MSDSRYRADDGATLRRIVEVVQRLLVGLALLLACTVVGALPAAAQNGVGVSTPVMINTVGAATDIGAGQRLGETVLQPVIVVATGVAAEGAATRGAGDAYASLIRQGGRADRETVFAGHGEFRIGSGTTTVPEGTSVTTYAPHGQGILDSTGGAVETGGTSAAVRGSAEVIEAGAVVKSASVAAEGEAGVGNALVKSEWPANRGFLGDPVETTLKTGTRIDRYGGSGGTFASPEGTPFAARSLRSTSVDSPYNVYEVVKPVSVQGGTVGPAFGYGGGGIQYEFGSPIQDLIDSGVLKRVGP